MWEMVPCSGDDIGSCPLHGAMHRYALTVKVSKGIRAAVGAGDLVTIGRV